MNLQLAIDVFQHHRFARCVGHDVMGWRDKAHVLLNDITDKHALGSGDGFLHVRACAEQEETEFPWGQCFTGIFCLHFLILGKAGKIE